MAESSISVRNVKIQYRVMNKMSLLKALINPKKFSKVEEISIDNGKEFITLGYRNVNWLNAERKQIGWTKHCSDNVLPMNKLLTPWFVVSQELIDLVKNKFKSEEDIRFRNQQILTWFSIISSIIIGLLGIISGNREEIKELLEKNLN